MPGTRPRPLWLRMLTSWVFLAAVVGFWSLQTGIDRANSGGFRPATVDSGRETTVSRSPTASSLPAAALDIAAHWSHQPGDGRVPRTPNPWFYLERAFPQGRIAQEDWQRAQLQARDLKELARQAAWQDPVGKSRGSWQPLGPTNVGGRITDLAVDPTNENVVYAGAAEGGATRVRSAPDGPWRFPGRCGPGAGRTVQRPPRAVRCRSARWTPSRACASLGSVLAPRVHGRPTRLPHPRPAAPWDFAVDETARIGIY